MGLDLKKGEAMVWKLENTSVLGADESMKVLDYDLADSSPTEEMVIAEQLIWITSVR